MIKKFIEPILVMIVNILLLLLLTELQKYGTYLVMKLLSSNTIKIIQLIELVLVLMVNALLLSHLIINTIMNQTIKLLSGTHVTMKK